LMVLNVFVSAHLFLILQKEISEVIEFVGMVQK
jgi:hypothetical protein